MADQNVGKVSVEVEARLDKLRAGMAQAKTEANAAGQQIGTAIGTGVGEGVKKAESSVSGLNKVFGETVEVITAVVGRATALVGIGLALGQSVVNYKTTWRAINEYVKNAFDSTKKTNDAITAFAASTQGLVDSLDEARINSDLGAAQDPSAQYELRLQLEERVRSKNLKNIEELAIAEKKRLLDAGMTEQEVYDRVQSFRQTAQESEDDRNRAAKFALGKDLFNAQDKLDKEAQDKKDKAAAEAAKKAKEDAKVIEEIYLEAFEAVRKAQDQAAKEYADAIREATRSLQSAVDAFANMNNNINGVGVSSQFIGQKLEGLSRIAETIRAQQVGAVSGTTITEGGF